MQGLQPHFAFLWRLRCPKAEALKVIIWFLSCELCAKSALANITSRAEAGAQTWRETLSQTRILKPPRWNLMMK